MAIGALLDDAGHSGYGEINPAVDDNNGNMSTTHAIEPGLSAQECQSVLVA
jgi:hypothetical protein